FVVPDVAFHYRVVCAGIRADRGTCAAPWRSDSGRAGSDESHVLERHQWSDAAEGRLADRATWYDFWTGNLPKTEEPAGSFFDARDFRADLRDVQDISSDARPVPDDPRDLYRGLHRFLFRLPAAARAISGHHHSDIQHHRNCRQLLGRVVRHSREYLRQFTHGFRNPSR